MTQEQTQEIALMRYSVIAPLISGLQDSFPSHEAYFRDASAKGITAPDGTTKHYAPATIKKWYIRYNQGGFDALIPSSRADLGKPRKLDDELQEQIRYLKNNYPRMSAAAIYRQLRDNGSIRPDKLSESTVNRYLNALAVEMKTTFNQDMRRYERPHINEVWCGDSSVGPYLKTDDGRKHRIHMIALIDDATALLLALMSFLMTTL